MKCGIYRHSLYATFGSSCMLISHFVIVFINKRVSEYVFINTVTRKTESQDVNVHQACLLFICQIS
jgi:hypothetical protein